MSATSVLPPFPTFTDSTGAPLESGYIYIGTANLNPETNPIAVYWDIGLTIPAAQPIRTSGGYPVRNGTPAALYVAVGECSIIVRDKNGALVFSGQNYQEIISSEYISFIQSGTGAVSRSVQDDSRERVSITQFGAVPGGIVDCKNAFWNAAVELLSRGGGRIIVPPGDWRCSVGPELLWAGLVIEGCGYSSNIVVDAGCMWGVKIGDVATAVVGLQCGVMNVRISRAAGAIPAGSVGLDAQAFNYAFEQDVFIEGFDFNRRITGNPAGISIGYECLRPLSRSAKTAHLVLGNAAGTKIFGGDLGNNAGDAYDCESVVRITGECNDVVMHGTNLMPRGPSVVRPHAIMFRNYTNTSGTFRFTDVDTENTYSFIASDAATPLINDLHITGGRNAAVTTSFNLDAATHAVGWSINGGSHAAEMTLVNPKWLQVVGAKLGAGIHLVGGADASAVVTGVQVLGGNVVTEGAWGSLIVDDVGLLGGAQIVNTATGAVAITEPTGYSSALTVTAQTGTFTSVSGAGTFYRKGNTVFYSILITITTNGTAGGWITVALPTRYGNSTSKSPCVGYHSSGTLMFGLVDSGTSAINIIRRHDSVYLGGDGTTIALSGNYTVV